VPSGVAGLTDHVLPYLLPVPDTGTFEQTVARAVAVDQPPPASSAVTATNLGALGALGTQNFFSPGTRHRVVVVITDAESRPFDEGATARALARAPGVTPVFIRVGSTAESVFDGGTRETGYHPDPAAAVALNGLAQAADGKVFGEGHLGAAAHAIRSALGPGPVRSEGIAITTRALAPYLALAALIPLLFLVAGGLLAGRRVAGRGTSTRAATAAASSRAAQPAQS
jgi:hypothetical protein